MAQEKLQIDPNDRVRALSEALPYMQKFAGRTIVIKYGGAAMKDGSLKEQVMRDVVFMACVGIRPVLVHGGGPEINTWLTKMNIEPQFKDGLRVTDADTMDIVEMVLVGRLNKQIVSLVNQAGGSAVGICGKDGNLVTARQVEQKEIGFVGEITAVNTGIIEALISRRHIPVVSSVAADETGQSYNINADTFAGEIAAALGAEKLVLMTDTPGLMKDFHDPESLIRQLDIREARRLVESGVVSGG